MLGFSPLASAPLGDNGVSDESIQPAGAAAGLASATGSALSTTASSGIATGTTLVSGNSLLGAASVGGSAGLSSVSGSGSARLTQSSVCRRLGGWRFRRHSLSQCACDLHRCVHGWHIGCCISSGRCTLIIGVGGYIRWYGGSGWHGNCTDNDSRRNCRYLVNIRAFSVGFDGDWRYCGRILRGCLGYIRRNIKRCFIGGFLDSWPRAFKCGINR